MSKLSELITLRDHIISCKRCPLSRLLPGGSHPIPFNGDINSQIMFVGEAPGAEETDQNKPFVGRSGKLLDSILNNAGINRNDIIILNSVKCRPFENNGKFKKNRTPTACEIDSCKNWLKEEINLIKPLLVFTLGGIPLKTILEMGSNEVLKFNSQFRLKTYVYKTMGGLPLWPDLKVIPLYHPSYLLQYCSKREIELTENVINGAVNLMIHQLNKEKI